MILIGLIIFAIVGLVSATIFGLLLLLVAYLIVPKGAVGRKRAMILSVGFPFIIPVYLGIAFVVYAMVSEAIGRPIDYGDSWRLALGRGYQMLMIDTTDHAAITSKGPSVVADITNIEQVGSMVIGKTTGKDTPPFFLLDTGTGRYVTFADEVALRTAAKKSGVSSFTLHTTNDFYYQHRIGSFERWAYSIIGLFPVIGFCWLIGYLVRLRRRARFATP
jgi:hypothetical protein